MTTVKNANGDEIDFEAAVHMMDDELREEIHADLAPCDPQEFVEEYARRHAEKFDGDRFAPYYDLPW